MYQEQNKYADSGIGGLGMGIDLSIHPQLLMCGQVYGDNDHTDEHADGDGGPGGGREDPGGE